MNYYLTAQASEDFHPEFYVTVATVLPLLLLVTNLITVYVSRWRPGTIVRQALLVWRADYLPANSSPSKSWWPRVVAISMACLNIVAEMTCLIVLFLRRGGTATSIIIWVGLGFSMAWTLLLLSTYIIHGETPDQTV
jgi:hypothetical protein